MKSKSKETNERWQADKKTQGDYNTHVDQDCFKIINISKNFQIHDAIYNTLKFFSLNGKKLCILKASSLEEGISLLRDNPCVILIMIDNAVHVNGSYHKLESVIQHEIQDSQCIIAFKKEISKFNPTDIVKSHSKQEVTSDFDFARSRLIDILRMIMMTLEMEAKIEEPDLLEIAEMNVDEGQAEICKESENITREKLYTILAHDLKTPVNSIRVMLDFLTNEPDLLDKKSSKELLMSVKESAHLIHELLDNFLFWTRMHKHDINFNPVRLKLSHTIRENITLLKSIAINKNIKISNKVSENLIVFADEYMLTTVIRNLVYNAIKFTRKGGEIKICASENGDTVEISICDNGIGILKDDLEKIFKTDVHFSTKGTMKESGTGLGLILCKDFIEKNGGQIFVESEQGKGSTFRFTIPSWKKLSMN